MDKSSISTLYWFIIGAAFIASVFLSVELYHSNQQARVLEQQVNTYAQRLPSVSSLPKINDENHPELFNGDEEKAQADLQELIYRLAKEKSVKIQSFNVNFLPHEAGLTRVRISIMGSGQERRIIDFVKTLKSGGEKTRIQNILLEQRSNRKTGDVKYSIIGALLVSIRKSHD